MILTLISIVNVSVTAINLISVQNRIRKRERHKLVYNNIISGVTISIAVIVTILNVLTLIN